MARRPTGHASRERATVAARSPRRRPVPAEALRGECEETDRHRRTRTATAPTATAAATTPVCLRAKAAPTRASPRGGPTPPAVVRAGNPETRTRRDPSAPGQVRSAPPRPPRTLARRPTPSACMRCTRWRVRTAVHEDRGPVNRNPVEAGGDRQCSCSKAPSGCVWRSNQPSIKINPASGRRSRRQLPQRRPAA